MMNIKYLVGFCVVAFVLTFLAHAAAIYLCTGKSNNIDKFHLSPDQIVKDLDGKMVPLLMNQVWPFDASQNVSVNIIAKKAVDEFVCIIVDVRALAVVQQEPIQEKPKEHTSINPAVKDTTPKTANTLTQKFPSKVALSGKMKLTYEFINNEWYLLTIDNLSLKATPLD